MARRPLAGALIVLICSILLPFLCLAARTAQDVADIGAKRHEQFELKPDHAGYLPIDEKLGSAIYYAYFEARNPRGKLEETPVILWLQGGPGCSSLFGMLYINGPFFIHASNLTLYPNPGAWNKHYGMLFVDQPIGTGFSPTGQQPIPDNEVDLAAHLYAALQGFYRLRGAAFAKRPLYVTGESYAGKYVPSITHYILQAWAANNNRINELHKTRKLPANVEAPVFQLGGMAIGNGFTDARTQTLLQAQVAWNMGLIDLPQKEAAEALQNKIVNLMDDRDWRKARKMADQLMAFLANASGSATLEDIRRNKGYDAADLVSRYINRPAVKSAMNARQDIEYSACSDLVDATMGHDVMKSVSHLVPDILQFHPVLLYHGQFDAECGFAGNDAWINDMVWHGHLAYRNSPRYLWMQREQVLGYWKHDGPLTHVVIRNTGHMVPHDSPLVGQRMIELWLEGAALDDKAEFRPPPLPPK